MTRVGISGAAGKMGRSLVRMTAEHPGLQLTAAWERPGHPLLGQDAGELAGVERAQVALAAADAADLSTCDVAVDFSAPEATVETARKAAQARCALVVGTTGLDAAQLEALRAVSKSSAVIYATNYSVGINLLWILARQTAQTLGGDFDVEIIEAHHNQKKDAPSGTAMTLYQEICRGRGLDPNQAMRSGREGLVGARTKGEVGVLAVRGGDIVGDHTVLFAGPGERLEFKHQVHSRDTLARGAIRAAAWIAGKPAGWYSMADVLGLKA